MAFLPNPQVASEWDQLHARYVERTSRHQNQSDSSRSSPLLTKRSTQSTTSSEGSCGPSTTSIGRDLESVDAKPPPPPTTAPPPSKPPPPTDPLPQSDKPPHNTYVNFTVLPKKDGDDFGRSWDGSVTVRPSGKEENNDYEVPFTSMQRSKSQEIFPARDGDAPSYENWQVPQPGGFSKVPLPSGVGGKTAAVKKPMPIQRKTGATKSTVISGRLLTEPKAALKSVPRKPNPPPKPKGLEQATRTVSPPHYSQVTGAAPHGRPMSDVPATMTHLAKLTSLNSAQEHGTDGQKQLPMERKPRSNTTANVPSPERKQPLLPPPLKGSKVPSPSRSANKPPETIPEASEDSNSLPSTDARSLQSSWEHKAPTGLRSAVTAAPKDAPPPTGTVTSTAARDEEVSKGNELMRKLSKRREKLEHQLTPRRHPNQSSSAHATNCSSECSSTASSHSELLVSYSEKRTDEPEGGEAPVVSRTNQVNPEEGSNLAKYGIIEDVAGGSYVI